MLLGIPQLLTYALVAVLLSAGGCMTNVDHIQGSGVAKTETRDVPAFTRIDSMGSAKVTVTIGDHQSVSIEADDNILPLIDTIVKGDRLQISSHDSYSARTPIKVTITVAKLEEARVQGSGSVNASGVDAKRFDAHISGSGDINVSGTAQSLTATVTGSGKLDATKMPVDSANVTITGSGDVTVNASKSMSANITGSGDIRYAGNPSQVQQRVTGSGNVRKI